MSCSTCIRLTDHIQHVRNGPDGLKYFYPMSSRLLSISEDNPSHRVSYAVCLPFSILETVFFTTLGITLFPLECCGAGGVVIFNSAFQIKASVSGVKACALGVFNPKEAAIHLKNSGAKYTFK